MHKSDGNELCSILTYAILFIFYQHIQMHIFTVDCGKMELCSDTDSLL